MPLFKRPKSDIWWISLYHEDHPRIRQSSRTTDKRQAQQLHDELQAKLWALPKTVKGLTWGRAVEAWLDVEPRSESELLSLRKFSRHFKDRKLSDVHGVDIESALSFCNTAGTYMRYRSMIHAILAVAKKRKWLAEIPDIPVRRDKKKKTRDWLTPEQWDCLYAELPDYLKPPARLAINTGLRQANVFELRWADVDLERRVIVVRAEKTKPGESLNVPLNDTAVEALNACLGKHEEYVFTYRGRPMKKPKDGFRMACKRAKVPDFVWHGIRHTWATWHAQNGTPLEVLQKLGGWADLRMVMNYAAYSPSFAAQFVNNVKK